MTPETIVPEVQFEIRGQVAVITINRPEKMNAINTGVRAGLYEALDRFEASNLRAAVLTGAGDRAFCAGMDLKEAAAMGTGVPPRDFLPIIGDTVMLTKPVIAAVNGIAYAGGWLFAQMCDLCVASENASFAITESRVGRGMPWAVPLVHMIPQRVALELLLTGTPISAQRGYEVGFVNHVTPPGGALDKALELADRLAEGAPLTVAAAKETMRVATEMGRSAALIAAHHIFDRVYRSRDALEGPRAFAEKRKPDWTGE